MTDKCYPVGDLTAIPTHSLPFDERMLRLRAEKGEQTAIDKLAWLDLYAEEAVGVEAYNQFLSDDSLWRDEQLTRAINRP